MKLKKLKRKAGSLLLAAAMIIPSFPASGTEVHAAEVPGGTEAHASEAEYTPKKFATKKQLMSFNTDDTDGVDNSGTVYFGTKENMTKPYIWWVAGSQSEDSVTLFAAEDDQWTSYVIFSSDKGEKDYSADWGCHYSSEAPAKVDASHYGGSDIRAGLKEIENKLTEAERAMMMDTKIYTEDLKNGGTYYTEDKLYLAHAGAFNDKYITVGENASDNLNNGLRVDKNYWGDVGTGGEFWLRSPNISGRVMSAGRDGVSDGIVNLQLGSDRYANRSALKLDVSSVLFASAAVAASSDDDGAGGMTIRDIDTMTLRLDGSDKKIGVARYDAEAGIIKAQKDADAAGTVSLVVQGRNETKNGETSDWFYSVPVEAEESKVVTKEQIQSGWLSAISGEIDLADCKIWLETKENGMSYAKMAAPSPSKYVTAKQLRQFNTDNRDDSKDEKSPSKVRFGKNSNGSSQEWWIAGSQSDDSVTLFAASPMATEQKFDSNYTDAATKSYNAGWNCTYPDGTSIEDVNVNHYGGSTIRDALKGLETDNFSDAEKAMMMDTKIYTDDTKNDCVYSTTDKLYLAYGVVNGKYITVGENASDNLNNGLRIDIKYWESENRYSWLRSPGATQISALHALRATDTYIYNSGVQDGYVVSNGIGLVPAFKLNLSSVLFASAAKASSANEESGWIEDNEALTLRLDGSDKNMGTAYCDAEAGKIVVQNAQGTVSLVMQGEGENGSWYYSMPVDGTTIVTKEQIVEKITESCGISDINLAECRIWLETAEDSVIYAKRAEAKNLNEAITLEPGQTVIRADETVSNSQTGTVTVDKGHDGTIDMTIQLPEKGDIAISADGEFTVPAGGTVQITGGTKLTLPEGGTVDTDGNVEADNKLIRGDITVTAPQRVKVTADKDGNITVPENGKVQATGKEEILLWKGGTVDADGKITIPDGGSVRINDGLTLTLQEGGTVDTDGNVTADKIESTKAAVTAPEGKKVTADKAGNITVPAGGIVKIEDEEEQILTYGGIVDKDGNIQPADENGDIIISAWGTVETESGNTLRLPSGGTMDKDKNVKAEEIRSGSITVTAPEGEKVTADKAGNITVPAGGTVETESGRELRLPSGGTVGTDGNITADKMISGDLTVAAPAGETLTADKEGNITVPDGGTVETEDGKTLTLPAGGTVDKDGNITVPAGGKVQTGDGKELTLPVGGTVDKDGNIKADKIISGDLTVTAPEGEKVTADKEGNITVPAGGTVQTGDGTVTTMPNGGTIDKAGNITEQFFEGEGTLEEPYRIETENDLRRLAEIVNSGRDPKNAHYKIESREGITLTEESRPWTPIGTAEHPFTGTFDGAGKTIKGLEISGNEPKDNQGLFGVNAGTIKNLTVEGSVTGKDCVGGIAGTNAATGTIQNCTADVTVTGQNNVGGIVGKNDGAVIDCTNKGNVTGQNNVGGIAGTNGTEGTITDNVNNGNVTGGTTSTTGAVIGKNDNPDPNDIFGNYYQKTEGINGGITGIGGTPRDPVGITSGSSPTPGGNMPTPTPGGNTPTPTPGGNTPTPTPGGSTPTPTPGGNTPTPTPGGSTPTPTPGGDKPGTTPGDILSDLTPEQKEIVNQIAKGLNVPVETAKKLQEMAQQLGIGMDTLLLTDQDILNQKSEGDVKGSSFSKIQAKAAKVKKNRITVKWNKVKGADGYQIYAGKCGINNKYKLVKTIQKASATSFTYKKLKKGTAYKFVVKAYKNVDGKKYTVAASRNIHETTLGGKRTNPKSVKVNKKTVKIGKGKKFTIRSKIVKASSGKKLLNHRKISYESTNKKIAAVSKKGVIRGKKKGTCYVYIYAENGIFKKIKVTVK